MSSLSNDDRLSEPISPRDHRLGRTDAPITILEYGDYECPGCLNAVPIIREVRRILGDQLLFVFRHFPQSSIHPHASAAAEAAESAADQGKFWEMHQALFDHQKQLGEIDFSHLALTLGMEIYKFEANRSSQRHRRRIREDFESGQKSGVTKTPTLFINSRKYVGEIDARSIVEAAREVVGADQTKP
ncbi:MAG TPA: thioredoxin domain-containing protein [Tepidisphaeraceae bacterium]|jgi:protein-disulfide isomerase|nr:thioredoxin domain-containing protein [Tepidisphaeraceae bacterium]